MNLFSDELIPEYKEWREANPDSFTWWNYVNIKHDIESALALAKFFYPEVIDRDGFFLLADNFSEQKFQSWRTECKDDKNCVEKMMNLYEIKDFFHINSPESESNHEQIRALGEVLKLFWSLSFKDRFPERVISVKIIEEDSGLYITVIEEI